MIKYRRVIIILSRRAMDADLRERPDGGGEDRDRNKS
jgi:hypothetical protein